VITAMWLGQVTLLWPLPSEAAAQLLVNMGGRMANEIAYLERSDWISWVVRLVLVCAGVTSAAMLAKRKRSWVFVFVAAAAAYFVAFQPWLMLKILDATSWSWLHAVWLLGHLAWIYSIVIFPAFLIVTSAYGVIVMLRYKRSER
jgi:hypothetical protein